jgi:hypothetical protein
MDNLDSSVKSLKKQLESHHGIHEGKLMSCLSWVEKYTTDKRARPSESRQAIAWLKERGLWQAYLNEYVRDKPKGSWGGKREGAGWKDREKGESSVIVSCRISVKLRDDHEIDSNWLKDAIARKIAINC